MNPTGKSFFLKPLSLKSKQYIILCYWLATAEYSPKYTIEPKYFLITGSTSPSTVHEAPFVPDVLFDTEMYLFHLYDVRYFMF